MLKNILTGLPWSRSSIYVSTVSAKLRYFLTFSITFRHISFFFCNQFLVCFKLLDSTKKYSLFLTKVRLVSTFSTPHRYVSTVSIFSTSKTVSKIYLFNFRFVSSDVTNNVMCNDYLNSKM